MIFSCVQFAPYILLETASLHGKAINRASLQRKWLSYVTVQLLSMKGYAQNACCHVATSRKGYLMVPNLANIAKNHFLPKSANLFWQCFDAKYLPFNYNTDCLY